jgi:hypothetical protein
LFGALQTGTMNRRILRTIDKNISKEKNEERKKTPTFFDRFCFQLPLAADTLLHIIEFLSDANDVAALSRTCLSFFQTIYEGIGVWDNKVFEIKHRQVHNQQSIDFLNKCVQTFKKKYKSGCNFSMIRICYFPNVKAENFLLLDGLKHVHLHGMEMSTSFLYLLISRVNSLHISSCTVDCALNIKKKGKKHGFFTIKLDGVTFAGVEISHVISSFYDGHPFCINAYAIIREYTCTIQMLEYQQRRKEASLALLGPARITIPSFLHRLHIDPFDVLSWSQLFTLRSLTIRIVTENERITKHHLATLASILRDLRELTLIDTFFFTDLDPSEDINDNLYVSGHSFKLNFIYTHPSRLQRRTYCSMQDFNQIFPNIDISESLLKNVRYIGREYDGNSSYSTRAVELITKTKPSVKPDPTWMQDREELKELYHNKRKHLNYFTRSALSKAAFSDNYETFSADLVKQVKEKVYSELHMAGMLEKVRLGIVEKARKVCHHYIEFCGYDDLTERVSDLTQQYEAIQRDSFRDNDDELLQMYKALEQIVQEMSDTCSKWPGGWSLQTGFQVPPEKEDVDVFISEDDEPDEPSNIDETRSKKTARASSEMLDEEPSKKRVRVEM